MNDFPPSANKVFKGVLFDVYQWEQELYDGSFKLFEKVKVPDGVTVFARTPDKKFILLHEEQPYVGSFTGLPSGHVEHEEDPLCTAKRELLEELGMQAKEWELLFVKTEKGKLSTSTYVYLAKDCRKVQEAQLEPGEKISAEEFIFEELLEESQKESFRAHEMKYFLFRLLHNKEELKTWKDKLCKGEENE
ncbi:NUDIX hydrolase [Candidatus Woesearchaeota archaeon]|nr:NUDIX hydrolase [Candidatus Woesearchaeota archaeon]